MNDGLGRDLPRKRRFEGEDNKNKTEMNIKKGRREGSCLISLDNSKINEMFKLTRQLSGKGSCWVFWGTPTGLRHLCEKLN